MREQLSMMVAMQMAGYMNRTGACPQPGDVKNMVKAAEVAVLEIEVAMRRIDEARERR